MTNGEKQRSGALETAGAIVGLLTGIVAAIYVLGGIVIALRMLFDEFSLNTVVTILGQLPRELVVSTAMLNVLGPAATVGLLAALLYGAFDRPRSRGARSDDLDKGRHAWALLVGLFGISVLFSLPAIVQAVNSNGFSPLLLTSLIGIATTFGIAAAGVYSIRRVGRTSWLRLPRAAAAGAIWALIAVVPSVMLASSLDFEEALVCTSNSQLPETGQLIGEGGGKVLLGEQLGGEASVVSLPSDQVTKSQFGDVSSVFACPAPPGATPPAVEEAKLGGHGSDEERRLAMELRPRLRFDSHERWRPIEVGAFIAEHAEGAPHGECAGGADPPCPPLKSSERLSRRGDAPAYVDIHGSARNGEDFRSPRESCLRSPPAVDCNSGPAAVIYYRRTTHEGHWYWDYWWFLRYNNYRGSFNRCILVCADHEGDWEGITVITTPSLKPEILGAIYASHKERVLVQGTMLPTASGHPLVWVADGTHASYPFDCARKCHQYGPLPEETHDGAVPWGGNVDGECKANDCVRPLPEIGKPADDALPVAGSWAGWPGLWGETCHGGCKKFRRHGGFFHNEASPSSPGAQGRFQCPWVPTLQAQPAEDGSGLKDFKKIGDKARLFIRCQAQRGGN